MLAIENEYGSFGAGISALSCFEAPELFIKSVFYFLQVMSGETRTEIESSLNMEKLFDSGKKISDTLRVHRQTQGKAGLPLTPKEQEQYNRYWERLRGYNKEQYEKRKAADLPIAANQ